MPTPRHGQNTNMDYKGNTEKGWASEALSLVTIGQVMTGSMWQKETSTTQGPPSRPPSSCGQENPVTPDFKDKMG